jgi:predicted hydrocarbon binding protein
MPNAEDIRNPGYVISKFSDKNKEISVREFFFPEMFYSELEARIKKELGKNGEAKLYSIGKRFGYRYAMISRYGKISTLKEKGLLDFMYMFTRYIEVVYAKKLEHKIDFDKKMLELTADSYAGCEQNGLGYILLIGAWTGVWSFIMDNKKIDGIQITCQGRGDQMCKLVCAPQQELKRLKKDIFTEADMEGLEENYPRYEVFNKVYPSANKNLSLKNLIETGIFKYEKGKLFFGNERMVGIEFSTYYLLDNGFSKDKKTREILFSTAFEAGKKIANGKDSVFVQRFLSSIGFGDVQILSEKGNFRVRFYHFPWASLAKECDFVIISGFTSGLLSAATKKKIELKKVTKTESGDGFHIKLD